MEMDIPVSGPEGQPYTLFGNLCKKQGDWPSKVVFFVHGTTLDSRSFDWQFKHKHYSAVQKFLGAGYATMAVDRLGSGRSTAPASTDVTVTSTVATLHQVVEKLRDGSLGASFDSVYFHGHSQGSVFGWVLGQAYPQDFDAFVIVGAIHDTPPALFGAPGSLLETYQLQANLDPAFSDLGLDPGYITMVDGAQGVLWFGAGSHIHSSDVAETLKSFASFPGAVEAALSLALQNPPPELGIPPLVPCGQPGRTSPSCALTKPVYVMAGDVDTSVCGGYGPLPMPCTTSALEAFESQFYPPGALDGHVYIPEGTQTGHYLFAHDSYDAAAEWLISTMQADGL